MAPGGTTPPPLSAAVARDDRADRGRGEDADEIRRRLATDVFLWARLEDAVMRRLEVARSTGAAAALAGVAGIGTRLLVPLTATALAGQWTGLPWGQWAAIAVILGLSDAWAVTRHEPPQGAPLREASPSARRMLAEFTALVGTIEHRSDVRELRRFVRRWYRLGVSAAVAVAVALAILFVCLLLAPDALLSLPAGSLALLAVLLYDFGELSFQSIFSVSLMGRLATFDHALSWWSPVDSPEVQAELRAWATMQFMIGVGVTLSLLFALILVGLDSGLVVPLSAGMVVSGYLTTLLSMVAVRSSVARIVGRTRARNLAVVQARLAAYRGRFADLAADEAVAVEHLLDLHDRLRDAPSSPRASQTLVHAGIALVIPTLMFVASAFGEVIVERVLDALLT